MILPNACELFKQTTAWKIIKFFWSYFTAINDATRCGIEEFRGGTLTVKRAIELALIFIISLSTCTIMLTVAVSLLVGGAQLLVFLLTI